jgi:outer membrane putative beta-barrel porin/alpha-amylase
MTPSTLAIPLRAANKPRAEMEKTTEQWTNEVQFIAQANSYGLSTHRRRTTLMPFKELLPGPMRLPIRRILVAIVILPLTLPGILSAQEPRLHCRTVSDDSELPSAACDGNENDSGVDKGAGTQNRPSQVTNSGDSDWVHRWMRKADEARASQPHFVSPIVTTHVMLVQQYRYDMSRQQDPAAGTSTSNYGASKGLEIIPSTRLEIGIFPPNYLAHQSSVRDGFGDLSFQVKFRVFSAPEGRGDYFVGFFLSGSLPTGSPPDGIGHAILSPTLAAAKGIGHWDIQTTVSANLPTSGANLLGRAIVFNTAVDYKIKGRIWPMLEQNSEFWSGGILDGKKQVFLTPGLVFGSFPLAERLRLSFGAGVQIAVTQFHQYNHRWILSVRFPF